MNFMALWSKKNSIFVIDSYLKDSAFTAVTRDAKFWTRYVEVVPFANKRHRKGTSFNYKKKTGYKSTVGKGKQKGETEFPYKNSPPKLNDILQSKFNI